MTALCFVTPLEPMDVYIVFYRTKEMAYVILAQIPVKCYQKISKVVFPAVNFIAQMIVPVLVCANLSNT